MKLEYMEDVNKLTSQLTEMVHSKISEIGYTLSDDQEDMIWEVLAKVLEQVANYPYYKVHH